MTNHSSQRHQTMDEHISPSALSEACTSNSITTAVSIISSSPELINEPLTWTDSDGKELVTPAIFIAIDYGHVQLVREMLQFLNGDVNIDTLKSGTGDYTALSWASWAGRLEIVKLLVEEGGAKVDDESLSLARESSHKDVTEYLLQHIDLYSEIQNDPDAMMDRACREGDVNMVRKLIEEEGYGIEKCALGPMYMAVKFGQIDVVQFFREKGVDIDLDMAGEGTDKFKAMAKDMEDLTEEGEVNSLAEEET
ncbi:hypothetical protein HJC23_013273 [Cyclotella cryptica]|uniref:Ankyrin n=1 Tax=Cyclotella cryptica TaxID=29204 RepID=A0ABD3PFQ2_9STRA